MNKDHTITTEEIYYPNPNFKGRKVLLGTMRISAYQYHADGSQYLPNGARKPLPTEDAAITYILQRFIKEKRAQLSLAKAALAEIGAKGK